MLYHKTRKTNKKMSLKTGFTIIEINAKFKSAIKTPKKRLLYTIRKHK